MIYSIIMERDAFIRLHHISFSISFLDSLPKFELDCIVALSPDRPDLPLNFKKMLTALIAFRGFISGTWNKGW